MLSEFSLTTTNWIFEGLCESKIQNRTAKYFWYRRGTDMRGENPITRIVTDITVYPPKGGISVKNQYAPTGIHN